MDLQLRGIWKRDPGAPGPLLRGITLTVSPGELVCVLGASGCGKSTLLRIAAGLEPHDSGEVLLDGNRVRSPGTDRLLLFQDQDQLFPWLTAADNVAFALSAVGRDRSEAVVRAALDEVELSAGADLYPHQLSGGMRQRVALARTLSVATGVLLMDEPFANLDAPSRVRLQDLLLSIRRERNATVLFVTHDIGEAMRLGDRIVVMGRAGTIIADRTVPADRSGDSAGRLAREFVTLLGPDRVDRP